MTVRIRHIGAILSVLVAFIACNPDSRLQLDPEAHVPIQLSLGGLDAVGHVATKAAEVITDETSPYSFSNFDKASNIFMVMKSEYVNLPSGYSELDFRGSNTTKYCVTMGSVAAGENELSFTDAYKRYWDDAHSRSSRLSIWAYTAPGATFTTCTFGASDQIQTWKEAAISPVINTWKVTALDNKAQNEANLINQNLCFTNNIVDYTSQSGTDRRLGFKTPEKKFEGGKLVFYHAMAKLTIHIKKGLGYTNADPFKFATGTNVKLHNVNFSGTFSIEQGKFTATTADDIVWIAQRGTAESGDAYTLDAVVIPGTTHSSEEGSILHKGNANTSMSIIIDDNLYNISQDALLKALVANSVSNGIASDATAIEYEAGKNYDFTFTIGKKQIDNITAQVIDWQTVTANELTPSNARIKLQVEERGDLQTSGVKVYRGLNQSSTINDDYESYLWDKTVRFTDISATYDSEAGHWTSPLFWESNRHFYHFRALMPDTKSVTEDTTNGDYVALEHGETYTDVLWGAPMKDNAADEIPGAFTWNYGPTSNGFDGKDGASAHQIYKAIGPTEDQVKLILFHAMSDLSFTVKTTTGADKVDFGDGNTAITKIELKNINKAGKVLMGNGLCIGTDTPSDYEFTAHPAPDGENKVVWNNYGAIPQLLTNVILVITTADDNQYKVAMKDVVATTVPETNIANPYTLSNGKYKIDRWYPGFKYEYSFTLKKTGIENITATLVDWNTVNTDDQTVQIQ